MSRADLFEIGSFYFGAVRNIEKMPQVSKKINVNLHIFS